METSLQTISRTETDRLHLVGFTVEDEEFGVDILAVQEIIRMVEITKVPNTPYYVEGIINLRGRVLPVINFRKKFNMGYDSNCDNEHKRIVVVDINGTVTGVIVDKVSQVLKISKDHIDPPPPGLGKVDTDCLKGVGRLEDRLIILLDLHRLFGVEEMQMLSDAA